MLSGLASIFGIVDTVVDRLVPDKAEASKIKSQIELETSRAAIAGELAQIDLNKAEASNPNLFVSGWRPFIGWVCGAALTYEFVLAPISQWLFAISGNPLPPPPMLDDVLWQLIFGMLGMGGLRTFEKVSGVAK